MWGFFSIRLFPIISIKKYPHTIKSFLWIIAGAIYWLFLDPASRLQRRVNWKAQTYLVTHHFQDIYVCRHEIRISHIAHLCRAMCKTFHKKSWRFIAPQLMIDNILPSTQRKELWRFIFCINLCRSVQGQGIQAVHVVIKRYCSACQWKCFSYTLWGIERVYCT